MAPRKRKRVPEFLRALFRDRVRSLSDTILDFIPPPPAPYSCKSHHSCLYCSGDQAMSFLVRSTDDLDYRDLLEGCFVVVSDHAPPNPVFDHRCGWSQLQIVRRTVELILLEQPTTSNLICREYDKEAQSSPAVTELTSAKWTLLLNRVGDTLMVYLLKYTSMFLPLPLNEHHQISGSPVANLCSNVPRLMPKPIAEHHPPGSNNVFEELPHTPSERNSKQNTVKPRRHIREHSWQRKRKRKLLAASGNNSICDLSLISSSSQNDIMHAWSSCVSEELPPIQIEGNSKQDTVKPRKRRRECRWRRERKRRQLAVSGMLPLLPHRGSSSTCDNLPLVPSSSQNDTGNMAPLFCYLVFQNQPRIRGNAEIDRKNIFYRMENYSSMLPWKHILYTLRPNDSGASILFNNIFAAFGPDKIYGSTPCCHTESGSPVNSTCLYSSLKVLLKKIIGETRYYRHERLLEKHCSVGSSNQDASSGAGTELEVVMVEGANAAEAEPVMGCLTHHQKVSMRSRRFRLRPKSNGFRMLANLQAPSRISVATPRIQSNQNSWRRASSSRTVYRYYKSVNTVLHDVHAVLKGLREKEPEKMGSSVFDYNDVYKKLVPFLFHLKNGSSSLPDVFMVVSNVAKAFDSVNHGKLLSVMKDAICDDEYTLEKFTQVVCKDKCLKTETHVMLAHQDISTASTRMRSKFPVQSSGGIVFKKDANWNLSKEKIHSLLEEHIRRNMVQFRNKFYLQQVGIPQGSVLSTLLCSFYYGHMERNVIFPFLEKVKRSLSVTQHSSDGTSVSGGNCQTEIAAPGSESLLLRYLDDFLFISASKMQASMFFTRLERGVRDYNCCMNKEKYGLNFTMENQQGQLSNRLHTGKDNNSFLQWSGLLVNCSTLEIQADYTRYLKHHIRSTLTVSCHGKVGKILKSKLRSYLRPKCHPILYDSNINSPGVVRLNIYQNFLLCAMKFICHLSSLSILPKFHPKFLLKAIETSLRYMNMLIRRRMYSFKCADFRPRYDVKRIDVIWLGLHAYSRVLMKKHLRFKTLLCLLRAKLKAYGEVENMSSELKYAVDHVHSSALWSIKY
ncbi:RNA-directed DNA polymerase [Salvia divinorum]|uniref:Telomerase reverse transcriptase n=1 Tax=Salvia divinorum TaxID=28513 RepID=A0ABD1H6G7_SALDI